MTSPSVRERLKPVELLAIAAICGVFTGLITLMSTRDWMLSGIFAAVAFIVTLVTIATLQLAVGPNKHEVARLERMADAAAAEAAAETATDGGTENPDAAPPRSSGH